MHLALSRKVKIWGNRVRDATDPAPPRILDNVTSVCVEMVEDSEYSTAGKTETHFCLKKREHVYE